MNNVIVRWKCSSLIALALLLPACGASSTSSSGNPPPNTYTATSGVAQKGPLLKGSTVTAQELDASLSPTGKQYTYQVNSDLGTFAPASAFGSRYIGLTATGYYFDEVRGVVSGGTITLNGVSDLGSGSVLNVNLLTTLAYQRISHLVVISSLSVSAATVQAENEVLAALNIPHGSSYGQFGSLDLSQGNDGAKVLAAVSSVFVYGNTSGQLAALIANFQSDIADNGVIDSATTKAALVAAAKHLSPATVAANLTQEYQGVGVSYAATDISNWIDQDGDGVVGAFKLQAVNGFPTTTFTFPASVVNAVVGSTVSASGGQLLVNGVAVASASINSGDTIAVTSPAAGTTPTGPQTLYLSVLSAGSTVHVARVTLAPALALLAGSRGGDGSLDGGGASASFFSPTATAVDSSGTVYVADTGNNTIRKITPAGVVTTLAGARRSVNTSCQPVDGTGPAATFCSPSGLAVDGSGNVYVADSGDNTIRKVTPAGVVTTLAGTAYAYSGTCQSADGSGATARFCLPWGIAIDGSGTLYVTDKGNNAVRKISLAGASGAVSTLATGVVAGSANLGNGPMGIAVDGSGNAWVADNGNSVVLKITPAGVVSTFAGTTYNANNGTACQSANDTGSAARFCNPVGVAVDASGNLYVSEDGNATLRKITPAGVVTTLAGTPGVQGSTDGMGVAASFGAPRGVAVDGSGTVFVADGNDAIRKVSPTGVVTTLAGSASQSGSTDGLGAAARFDTPLSVATDASGNAYVVDSYNNTVRKISPAGVVTTFAGTPYLLQQTCQFVNGAGAAARFCAPSAVAIDGSGNVYVADSGNSAIRRITPAGVVSTLVTGAFGVGLAVDGSGTVYATDSVGMRKISSTGVVSTLAAGVSGGAMAVSSSGTVYVTQGNQIVQVSAAGVVSTLAGSAGLAGSADGTGTAARFNTPSALALDGNGNLLVADTYNYTIRKITPTGVVSTVVGVAGSFGIGLGALPGSLAFTHGIAVTPNGQLIMASNDGVFITTTGGF
jgi:sugar lactone lactonase YvrE